MISIHLCKQLIFILVPLHSKEKNTFSIVMSTHSYNSLGPPWKLKDFLNHPGGVPHMWAAITHHMTHFFPPIVRQHEIMCTSTSVLYVFSYPRRGGSGFPVRTLRQAQLGRHGGRFIYIGQCLWSILGLPVFWPVSLISICVIVEIWRGTEITGDLKTGKTHKVINVLLIRRDD